MDLLLGEPATDNFQPLHAGVRYSPELMRAMTKALTYGIRSETQEFIAPNPVYWANVFAYSWLHDFITDEEMPILGGQMPIEGSMPQTEIDFYAFHDDPRLRNIVTGSIDAIATRLTDKKAAMLAAGQDPKVVFFHGKWNGVPHIGHLFLITDTCDRYM